MTGLTKAIHGNKGKLWDNSKLLRIFFFVCSRRHLFSISDRPVEVGKQLSCSLKLVNKTDDSVAFKVCMCICNQYG